MRSIRKFSSIGFAEEHGQGLSRSDTNPDTGPESSCLRDPRPCETAVVPVNHPKQEWRQVLGKTGMGILRVPDLLPAAEQCDAGSPAPENLPDFFHRFHRESLADGNSAGFPTASTGSGVERTSSRRWNGLSSLSGDAFDGCTPEIRLDDRVLE